VHTIDFGYIGGDRVTYGFKYERQPPPPPTVNLYEPSPDRPYKAKTKRMKSVLVDGRHGFVSDASPTGWLSLDEKRAIENRKHLEFSDDSPPLPDQENLSEIERLRRDVEQLRAIVHPSPPDYMVGPPREEKREPDPFGNMHPALMGLGRRV
jgi:hypothetical protein